MNNAVYIKKKNCICRIDMISVLKIKICWLFKSQIVFLLGLLQKMQHVL